MKRISGWILLFVLLWTSAPALAVDTSRSFVFDLSVNGAHEAHVMPGDIVTVVFRLERSDSEEPYTMYAMQNEIRYDDQFVQLIENGSIVSPDIETRDIALRGGGREFYMNYVSFADGEEWNANRLIGTFQLQINATSGATVLSNENFKVSLRDGSDAYAAQANDLTLIVSADCIVNFETNGGEALDSVTALYGELLSQPQDPLREGYCLEGWYSDIDLSQRWDFESMSVSGNMTLYAKWIEGEAPSEGLWARISAWFAKRFNGAGELFGSLKLERIGEWLGANGKYALLGLPLLLLVLLLLLLLGRKRRVIFVVNGGAPIDPMKVKRGEKLENLPIPVRGYSVFCGWYKDERFTDPWYSGVDKVTKRKTKLYAKWL